MVALEGCRHDDGHFFKMDPAVILEQLCFPVDLEEVHPCILHVRSDGGPCFIAPGPAWSVLDGLNGTENSTKL